MDEDSSSSENSSDSEEYERKVITRNNKQYDITFLNNKYKKRKNPPRPVARGAVRKRGKRGKYQTPDKYSKLKIIDKLHQRQNENEDMLSLQRFREEHIDYRYGALQWINKVSARSLRRYSLDFDSQSANYERLHKYVTENPKKKTSKKKRFYIDPHEESDGILPVFENYLVEYRKTAATEYDWRSVDWLKNEGQRLLQNTKILELIQPLMDRDEKHLLRVTKCSRSYINKTIVC